MKLEHVRGGATYERMIRPIVEAGQLRVVDGETELRRDAVVADAGAYAWASVRW